MRNEKNLTSRKKESKPGPDLSHMMVTLAVFKSAKENDQFYYHVIQILWANVDEGVKDLIREYFGELMDQDEKEEK